MKSSEIFLLAYPNKTIEDHYNLQIKKYTNNDKYSEHHDMGFKGGDIDVFIRPTNDAVHYTYEEVFDFIDGEDYIVIDGDGDVKKLTESEQEFVNDVLQDRLKTDEYQSRYEDWKCPV